MMEVEIMALTKKQMADFEKQLTEWKADLELGQNENVQAMHGQEQTSFPDPTDQASMETDRNFDLRIKDRERKLIKKIDQTIERLRENLNDVFGALMVVNDDRIE